MADFDEQYRKTKDVFGAAPEEILVECAPMIPRDRAVLDVGAGQGRNTLFLARKGLTVDAIDPSSVATETVTAIAESEQLSVRATTCTYDDFRPPVDAYGAILVFGLIPILSRDAIDRLVGFVDRWLHPGGLLFITGFTTGDDSCARYAREGRSVGRNSFANQQGGVRTYLEPDELPTLFPRYEVVRHREGLGPEHRHGDGPIERHALDQAVLQR